MKPGDLVELSEKGREKTFVDGAGDTWLYWEDYLNRIGFIEAMTVDKFPKHALDKAYVDEEGEYVVRWTLNPDEPEFYGAVTMHKDDIKSYRR